MNNMDNDNLEKAGKNTPDPRPVARRILVVEDDDLLLSSLAQLLTRSGYEVAKARDGVDALIQLSESSFDLVITDVLMPKADGLEMLQQIRQRWPLLKVIAISGGGICGAGMYLDLCRKFGATHVIEKPFSFEQLLNALGERLRLASDFCAATS
jgi:CheY-like chemotaxis protein